MVKGYLFRLMGLCFFSTKSSLNLFEFGVCQLGLSRNSFIINNNSFFKLYRGASAISLLSDSKSDCGYSSSGESRNLVSELLVYRKKQLLSNNKGYVKLSSMVVRVLKSLNWEAAILISFKTAVSQFGFSYTIDAFRMILCIFASADMSHQVSVMFRSMIYYYAKPKVKFNLPDFLSNFPGAANAVMVDVLIKVFASNLMLEDAVDVYNISVKEMGRCPGIRSCNFLLKCLLERGREDAILVLFKDMKDSGPSPNVYTYTIMMNFYCNRKFGQPKVDIGEATKIFHEMKANGISPTAVTYGTYFNGLVKGGYAEAAMSLMNDLRSDGKLINVYSYNAVIDALCRKGKLDEAMQIFEEMSSCKIAPDIYTYSILVRGLCESEKIEEALNLLKYMEYTNADIKPAPATYSPLLSVLCRKGLVKKSLQLFRDVCSRGYERDQVAYGILIGGFCIQGNLDVAHELLYEMILSNLVPLSLEHKSSMDRKVRLQEVLRGTITCTRIVNDITDGYCRKGYVKKALEFLDEMRYQGISVNIISYSIIVKWLCKEGNSTKALELIPLMMKWDMLPNVVFFSTLISGFVRELNIKMALTLYQSMQKFGVCPNTFTYTILICFYINTRNLEMASNYFKQMSQTGQYPDTVTYTILVSWYCKIKDMKKAYRWFKKMDSIGCVPTVVTYTDLAYGYLKQHRIEEAKGVMKEMERRGVSPDVTTYNVLAHGFLKQHRIEDAKGAMKEMEKKGVSPDVTTYNVLIQGFLKHDCIEEAKGVLKEMERRGVSPDVIACDILVDMKKKGILPNKRTPSMIDQ